jgi:hypothetical protein
MNKWIKIILALAVMGLLAAAYVWFFVYNKPHEDYAKAVPVASFDAAEAYRLFSTHDAKTAHLPGQVIEITGEAQKLETGDTLSIIVFVFNEGMFGDEGIRCSLLPESAAKAQQMEFPASIKIKGFCSGYNETDLVMEQCTLSPP